MAAAVKAANQQLQLHLQLEQGVPCFNAVSDIHTQNAARQLSCK
jgi:hypothetical protein